MQHLSETAMACSPGSAAPPAHDLQDEPVQIAPTTMVAAETHCAARPAEIVKRSAARPAAHTGFYTFAYYNAGWQKGSTQTHHNKENLAAEICDLVQAKCIDAVGISAVLNLREPQHMQDRQDIMRVVLSKLNNRLDRPVWRGESDGHYIFVWNSHRLLLKTYNYVSCGIEEQRWRMAQYFQF